MYLTISRFSAIFIIIISMFSSSYASVNEAEEFITKLNQKLFHIHKDKSNEKNKATEIEEVFDKYVDLEWVSRFVLGRYWNVASEKERKAFMETYPKYIKFVYIPQLIKYSESTSVNINKDKIKAEEGLQYGYEKNEYIVQTEINLKSSKEEAKNISINYYVRDYDHNNLKVFDIVAENISLALAQNNQIQSILSNNKDITSLISLMQKKINTK